MRDVGERVGGDLLADRRRDAPRRRPAGVLAPHQRSPGPASRPDRPQRDWDGTCVRQFCGCRTCSAGQVGAAASGVGRAAGCACFPNIRYGTERYPEKVARRLRALNIATWIASAVASGFAIVQFLDPTPGLWKVAAINALAAVVWATIPLLHRLGPLAATCLLASSSLYASIFVVLFFLGSGTGMQFYYLGCGGALSCCSSELSASFLRQYLLLRLRASSSLSRFWCLAIPGCCPLRCCSAISSPRRSRPARSRWSSYSMPCVRRRAPKRPPSASMSGPNPCSSNILPATIAERLKSRTEAVIADKFEEASILFADMAGFTARASDTAPGRPGAVPEPRIHGFRPAGRAPRAREDQDHGRRLHGGERRAGAAARPRRGLGASWRSRCATPRWTCAIRTDAACRSASASAAVRSWLASSARASSSTTSGAMR